MDGKLETISNKFRGPKATWSVAIDRMKDLRVNIDAQQKMRKGAMTKVMVFKPYKL